MTKNISIHGGAFKQKIAILGRVVNRYKAVLFFLLLAGLYGFILLRINTLSKVAPSEEQVITVKKTAVKIPESTIRKIQSLRDNSIRVQTLFDEARDNPF